MPPAKTPTRKPSPYEGAGSAEINTMVARVAPAILELLADGVPRTRPAIVAALAGQHDRQDVVHALIRLAVTGRVEESGGEYVLGGGRRRLLTRGFGRAGSPADAPSRRWRAPGSAVSATRHRGEGLPPADRASWAPWRPASGRVRSAE